MQFSSSINVTARRPSFSEEATHEQALANCVSEKARLKLSFNIVFPLLGDRATWSHEHLLPIFVSLIVALMLMAVPFPGFHLMMRDRPAPPAINEAWQVFSIIGIYIVFIINYYINQMCGRARSGLLQALVGVFTFWLLTTRLWDYCYDLFYLVIPAQGLESSTNALAVIGGDIFGTGLCEEAFKALPLIGLAAMSVAFAFLSRRTTGRLSALLSGITTHFGLREPLDGIVLGVASGGGFFIYETLVQYVPMVIEHTPYPTNRAFDGLVLLLARGIPELTAHAAYSGLFGYFIGLSVLRPGMAWLLIPLGWLGAAVLHGAWDATSDLVDSMLIGVPVHLIIGVLSYALLAGAIFKARDISPSYAERCAMLTGMHAGETKFSQAPLQGMHSAVGLAPAIMPRPEMDAADRFD
jgi:RsiW-degrading membrane proteinase PrsW (M82 family)